MANNNWGTPTHFIESARKVMGSIDCDPASNDAAQKVVQAGVYYTEETNGLDKIWEGNVWLNPPYGRGLAKPFIEYLSVMYHNGYVKQAIILTNSVYSSKWWNGSGTPDHCSAICLPNHRIAFINPDTGKPEDSNDRDQLITYTGDNPDLFCEEFSKYGLCAKPSRPVSFM
jgi:phage N-6-adenine-methyltransferase